LASISCQYTLFVVNNNYNERLLSVVRYLAHVCTQTSGHTVTETMRFINVKYAVYALVNGYITQQMSGKRRHYTTIHCLYVKL